MQPVSPLHAPLPTSSVITFMHTGMVWRGSALDCWLRSQRRSDQRDVATAADARDDGRDPVGEGGGVERALHQTLVHPLRGGLEFSLVLWRERGLDQLDEGVFEGLVVTRLEAK